MAIGDKGFTTMSGYVQRMKEEADRKEEEEKRRQQEAARQQEMARQQSLQAWRRDVPVGPPTQAQARPPLGPIERPKPNISLAPSPQSDFQVSREETDTSTPSLSSSQVTNNTVRSQATPSAFSPGSMTMDDLAKWNPPTRPKFNVPQMPPKNTGVAMPLGPSLLPQVGKQLLGMGQNLVQGLSNTDWQMPDYNTALGQLQQMGKAIFPQGSGTGEAIPADAAYQTMLDMMGQRGKERKNISAAATIATGLVGAATGNAGLMVGAPQVGKAITPLLVHGMNFLDIINGIGDMAQAVPVVQGGKTVAEIANTFRSANDYWTSSVDGTTNPLINMTDKSAWNYMSPEDAKNLVLFDPRLYANIGNMAEYWDMANKGMAAAFIPTNDQTKYNSPAEIEWAKNYARFMTQSGLAARTQTFDDLLDRNVNYSKNITKANEIARMADQTPDESLRNQMYAEAGRLGAEAVKSRDTTPLEVYNKNYDIRYAGPLGILFDPLAIVGSVSELAGLTAQARRAAQGQKLVDLGGEAAAAGGNKTLLESGKEFFMEWMKTGRSKANVDAFTNSSVITNVLSGVSTKGDIKTVIGRLIDGSIMGGIPLQEFNGVDMAVQADPISQLVDFGKSGIKDWRFQKAKKALEPVAAWLENIPSLQGEATEIANKVLVQADLIGMLVRAGAVNNNVSTMGDIPWGAARFRVSPTTNNMAVVEYLNEAKKVIGTSVEMTLRAATKAQADMQAGIATGQEFQTNWLREVVNLRRNIMSTFSINISPGQVINNAAGGAFTDMMNRGFDQEYFRPLDEKLEWLMNKSGGMVMSARVAEGAGEVAPTSARFGSTQGTVPQGQYDNWFGKTLNAITLGFAKKGRDLRQGNKTLFGGRVAVGEEAMAASIYEAAFRNFFEQEWGARLTPLVTTMLQGRIDDPKLIKLATDRLIQAGISGGRVDVARAFQEIADGRIGLTLRSISPVLGDVLPSKNVLEVDSLLANLGVGNLEQVTTQITSIFAAQRRLLDMDASKFVSQFGRRTFTKADNARDVADIQQMYENIARMTGQNMDIATEKAKEVGALQQKLNEYLLELMRMSDGQPGNVEYLSDVWNRIQDMKDTVRRETGAASANLRQFAKEAKAAAADTLETIGDAIPDAQRGATNRAYTVDESGNVLSNPARPPGEPYYDKLWGRDRYSIGRSLDNRPGIVDPYGPQGRAPFSPTVRKTASRYEGPVSINRPRLHAALNEDARLDFHGKEMPYTIEYLRQYMREGFNLSDDEADAAGALVKARADAWAEMVGGDPADYMYKMFLGVDQQEDLWGGGQNGGEVSAWATASQTERVIRTSRALREAEATGYPIRTQFQVLVHELGHIFRYDMEEVAKMNPDVQKLMNEAKQWAHADPLSKSSQYHVDDWTMRGEEYFAEGFEKYLQEGVAPTPGLKALFDTFKNWIMRILTGSTVDKNYLSLTDEMRNVYAQMLSYKAPANAIPDAGSRFTQGRPRTDKGTPWTQAGGSTQIGDFNKAVQDATSQFDFLNDEDALRAAGMKPGDRFTSARPGTPWDQAPFTTKSGRGPVGQQAADPEVDNLLNFDIQKEWDAFFKATNERWAKFGDDAIALMEEARTAVGSGKAKEFVTQRGLADMPELPEGADISEAMNYAQEMMSRHGVDLEMVDAVLKQKLGFKDPRFQSAITVLRQGVDHWQQNMFVALSRTPTTEAFDEYMAAIREVSVERGKLIGKLNAYKKRINDTENPLGEDEAAAVWKNFARDSKEGWNKWWNFAVDRYKVGAYRVIETNLPEATNSFTFTPYNDGKVWTLRGQNLHKPKVWDAINEENKMAQFPIGKGGVPKDVVDRFNEFRKATDLQIMDQLGVIASKAGSPQAADEWLSKWDGPGTRDLLNQVRQTVAERLANMDAKPFIPADLPEWYRTKLDQGEMALKQVLGQVAELNSAGYGRMGLDAISDFNRNVLPLFDDVMSGAHRYGEEMLGLGLVNFTNEYHPDILLGLGAPYHYWWSRSLKNSLERELFDPKVSRVLSKFMHAIETENRDNDQPNRNTTMIPGAGYRTDDVTYRAGAMGILRMIPWWPNMMMNGWSNPDVANRAYEYAVEQTREQAFPATAKGLAANASLVHELVNEFGLSTYPEYDMLFNWLAGKPVEFAGKLGDMSSLARTLGYGAVGLAEWARDNGIPLVPTVADGFATATAPNYFPSNLSRQAAFDVNQGKMTDAEGQMVQDVFAQQHQGLGPMPEQGLVNPNAVEQAGDIRQKVAGEYFVRGLLSWLSGVPIAAEYDGEAELREGQKNKALSGYDPTDNTAGSREARFSYTDPASKNFVPGLATYEDRYAVMGETAPQQTGDVARPGLSPAQSAYYDKLEAIKQKYLAEQQAEYEKHPEWSSTDGMVPDGITAKGAYDKSWGDRKEAEEEALKKQYPSVIAAQGKEKTPWSLYGARPAETEREAQVRLRNQAYDELEASRPKDMTKEERDALPNSEKVAYNKSWDTWNAALDARIAELMADPQAASAAVFDRALPRVGERPVGPTSDILRDSPMTSTTKNIVPQPKAADPNNQWPTQMSAAEQEFGLPSGMLEALARRESNFTPAPGNGYGMMQIENAAWKQAADALGLTDREDPEQAIRAAAYYMDWVNDNLNPDKQNDPAWMAAGYNMGVTAVNKMTSLEDIKQYDRYGAQRFSYVNDIAAASSGTSAYSAQPVAGGQTFTNPNWGTKIGKWTVVGDPITDTGLTWGFPFAEGDSQEVYQYYGETHVDGLGEYYKSKNQGFGHEGIDFMRPEGTDVLAIAEGVVIYAGDGKGDGRPAYGNMVVIEHPNGMKSRYGHLKDWDVNVGDSVALGQVIGGVGDTPTTANIGYHLHLSVESPFEKTGPYNTIDPFRLIGQGGTTQNVAQAAAPTVGQPASTTTAAAPANPDAIAWTSTPQQVADAGRNSNKSEAKQAADASIEQAFQGQIDRAVKTYPKYGKLFEEYKAVNEEDREAWRLKNPMIRALNFVAYNPEEWDKLEKDYGKGIIEKWALIPPYAGENSDVRSDYYHANPDVFLVNAWIKGRPEQYDESGFVPDAEFRYNLGADYEEAKSLFGEGIWDTVRQYYQTPKYVKGQDNSAWIAFKEEHPEFDAWSSWWYEKLGNTKEPYQFQQWGGSGYNGFNSGSGFIEDKYINPVQADKTAPPKWREGSGSDGDWRKYLALGELQLKGWRR